MSEYIIDCTLKMQTDLRKYRREPIVRCRDCQHGHEIYGMDLLNCMGVLTTGWDYWNDEPQQNLVEPDGFCAWGERKVSE